MTDSLKTVVLARWSVREIAVPFEIQQRAWDRAWALTEDFADRMTLEQLVQMHVIRLVAPERLGWAEVSLAVAVWAMTVEVRV